MDKATPHGMLFNIENSIALKACQNAFVTLCFTVFSLSVIVAVTLARGSCDDGGGVETAVERPQMRTSSGSFSR